MAHIDTLIDDIYKTLEDGIDNVTVKKRDAIYKCGTEVMEAITRAVTEKRDNSNPTLRMSQIGKPSRQVWYDMKNTNREPITGQTKIKFLFGDILESLLLCLTQLANHKYRNNKRLSRWTVSKATQTVALMEY